MRECIAGAVLSIAARFAVAPSPALAQQYDVVDLGTLGGSTSQANAISENGTIAGYATTTSSVKHAAIWVENGIVDIGVPAGFAVSEALAVNDHAQVACNAEGNPQTIQAYLWENGAFTPLGTLPGRTEAIAEDIDASGRIVGRSLTLGAANSGGFLWDAGVMTDLGTLGGTTSAFAINDFGQVVGRSQALLPGGILAHRAFIWQGGVITNLGVLAGEDFSQAFGINSAGDVVGSSWVLTVPSFLSADQSSLWSEEVIDLGLTPGPPVCVQDFPFYTDNIARAVNSAGHIVGEAQCVSSGSPQAAFLYRDGTMHNLNDLIPPGSGWNLLSAQDINDRGQIVGSGLTPGGNLHGFLLNPPCAGDIDGDNDTDVFDFAILVGNFGAIGLPPHTGGDLNGDGDVDVFDFGVITGDFGCPNR